MDRQEVEKLLGMPLSELLSIADRTRRESAGPDAEVELCSILNAKSGRCSEDCRFCAQSSHYGTGTAVYPLVSEEEMVEAARRAQGIGARRFGIVTSGNTPSAAEQAVIARAVRKIARDLGMDVCASLGALSADALRALKDAGLSRYHHNLETSRRYYPEVVSTHTFDDRLATIRAAKACGLEICSGGIIGLGESWSDRVDMALTLRDLGVDSVPLNFLVPVPGTPFGSRPALSVQEAVRTVCLFRIVLGKTNIRIAAGRESLFRDSQALVFMAGANGMMIGGYLTVRGRSPEDDHALVRQVRELWKT